MINKKISILIAGLVLGCSRLFAIADGIINFDIRPEFGILHGSVNEYVFEDKCKNTDNMESRLDWDVTAIPYIAGAADITILRYIFIGVNGRYGFPVTSGNMQDYDWLNSVPPYGYAHWINDDPTELTNYSKHNNFLDSYYGFSAELGGVIPVFLNFSITPVLAYEYSFIQFTGSSGYSIYKWNNFEEKSFPDVKVISYAQEANIFKIGAKLKFNPIEALHISSDIYFSPGTTSVVSLDKHFMPEPNNGFPYGKGILDKMEKGLLFQITIEVQYYLNKFANFGIKCGYEYLPLVKGSDYMKKLDKAGNPDSRTSWGSPTSALGGTSHYLWNWSLVYSVRF